MLCLDLDKILLNLYRDLLFFLNYTNFFLQGGEGMLCIYNKCYVLLVHGEYFC